MLQVFFLVHRDFFLVVLAKELCGHKNGLLCWCVYVFVFFSVNLKDVYDFLKWACGCRHTYFIVQYIFFNKNSLTTSSLSLLALNIIILGSHMWSCPPVMSKEYNRVITSLYTDVVFFFFSFFSKTSASSRAKRTRENERGAREMYLSWVM